MKARARSPWIQGAALALAMLLALLLGMSAKAMETTQTQTTELTEAEIAELESIYNRFDAIYDSAIGDNWDLSDEEIESRLAPYAEKIASLESRAAELEEKAGWYDIDYGELTEAEIAELEGIYERFDAIYDSAIGDDWDLSDEEIESRLAPYAEELESLESRAEELEVRAGWYDLEDAA